MTRFRRQTRHRARKRRGNSFYLIALLAMGAFIIWILTMDLEHLPAMQWMTRSGTYAPSQMEIKVYRHGHFGMVQGDSTPAWVTTTPDDLPDSGRVIFDQTVMERRYRLTIPATQLPLWHDVIRHTRHWSIDCDSMYMTYGPVPESAEIFAALLCVEPQPRALGLIVPDTISAAPFYEFGRPVTRIEDLTGLTIFDDILRDEDARKIKASFRRFTWLYPEKFYEKRMEEINNLKGTSGNL